MRGLIASPSNAALLKKRSTTARGNSLVARRSPHRNPPAAGAGRPSGWRTALPKQLEEPLDPASAAARKPGSGWLVTVRHAPAWIARSRSPHVQPWGATTDTPALCARTHPHQIPVTPWWRDQPPAHFWATAVEPQQLRPRALSEAGAR